MELIVITVIATALGTIFAAEFQAWAPRITQLLFKKAICKLPEHLRERYEEEWASHLLDSPGVLRGLGETFGFLISAHREKLRKQYYPVIKILAEVIRLDVETRKGMNQCKYHVRMIKRKRKELTRSRNNCATAEIHEVLNEFERIINHNFEEFRLQNEEIRSIFKR